MSRAKQAAAALATRYVEDGMIVGLGTGSTAKLFVDALAARVSREGLRVRAVPTSRATEAQALALGIPLVALDEVEAIDLTVDGADELDRELSLIKGGGGALLWEKIVASASRRMIVIADASKLVARLGAFPLPVEVMPLGASFVARRLLALGGPAKLRRRADGAPFVTDGGHHILDASFGEIADAPELARRLDGIVGVVEHGLFVGLTERAILGEDDGGARELSRP